MADNINMVGADFASRRNAELEQQFQAERAQQKQEDTDAKEAPKDTERPLTRDEIIGYLNDNLARIKELMLSTDIVKRGDLTNLMGTILRDIANSHFVTKEEATQIAKEQVPPSIYGFDSDSTRKTGDTLKLVSSPNGDQVIAAPGAAGGGLSALGDQVLYKGVFLREYVNAIPSGPGGVPAAVPQTIVPPGSEINPADYDTVANYAAALTAAGHSILATWDWMRAGLDVTG